MSAKKPEPSEQGGQWPQIRLLSKAGTRLWDEAGQGEGSILYSKETATPSTFFFLILF